MTTMLLPPRPPVFSGLPKAQVGLSTPFGISNASFKSKYRTEILYTVLCRIFTNYLKIFLYVRNKTMIDCKNLRLFAMLTHICNFAM